MAEPERASLPESEATTRSDEPLLEQDLSADPAKKPPPDRPYRPFTKPLPDVHPFALRYCKRCHHGFRLCRSGVRWGLTLALGIGLPSAMIFGSGALFGLFLFVAGFSAASYVILLVFHVVLLTFFFAKYSLGQFMTVLLTAGLCVSLLVELEGEWRIMPAVGLLVLFGIVLVYVGSYDPFTGNSVIPRAAREVLFNPPDAPRAKASTVFPMDGQAPIP